jgi:hypothetical protein
MQSLALSITETQQALNTQLDEQQISELDYAEQMAAATEAAAAVQAAQLELEAEMSLLEGVFSGPGGPHMVTPIPCDPSKSTCEVPPPIPCNPSKTTCKEER